MHKLFVACLILFMTQTGFALPAGNPTDPNLLTEGFFLTKSCGSGHNFYPSILYTPFSVRVGFYGDYVFNRHMAVANSSQDTIKKTEIFTNAGFIAVNLWDHLDFFGTLGASDVFIAARIGTFEASGGTSSSTFILETDTSFSWSLGLRGILWEWNCLTLGAEGQYFYAYPHINFVQNEIRAPVYLEDEPLKYDEWQIGLGIAYRIPLFSYASGIVPYAALKWSRANMSMSQAVINLNPAVAGQPIILRNLKSSRDFGYAVGLTLFGCDTADVTAEGRFADEIAVYINSQIRF